MVVNDEGWRRACGIGEGWMCVASVILLGAFACSAEPEPQPDPQPSELGRTAQALTNLGMARQIPVRVISLGRSQAEADRPATSTIRKALEYANHVYSPALLQVELAGVERYVVDSSFVKDEKTALSQADFEPFLEALGLPTDFCGSCCEQDCAINQRLLDVTGELYGSDEMILWSGLWDGGNSEIDATAPTFLRLNKGFGSEHVAHELGHNFGLTHTHEGVTASCTFWDLVYLADAGGVNRFFRSRFDCESTVSHVGADWLKVIDPRNRPGMCSFWSTIRQSAGAEQKVKKDDRSRLEQLRRPLRPLTLTSDRRFSSRADCDEFFADQHPGDLIEVYWEVKDSIGNVPARSVDEQAASASTCPAATARAPRPTRQTTGRSGAMPAASATRAPRNTSST